MSTRTRSQLRWPEPGGEIRSLGVVPNRPESIGKLVKKLGPVEALRVCYEAGPTLYVIYWQLAALGVRCEVVAPTLVPTKAGDRRDAEKLARSYRAGDLTAVWVPDAMHEALRDGCVPAIGSGNFCCATDGGRQLG